MDSTVNFATMKRDELPTLGQLSKSYEAYILSIAKTKTEAAQILGINRRTLYRRAARKSQ